MKELEQLYIGAKLVTALPMTEFEYSPMRTRAVGTPDRPGYRVNYSNGVTKWFPKDAFEASYRLVSPREMALIDEY